MINRCLIEVALAECLPRYNHSAFTEPTNGATAAAAAAEVDVVDDHMSCHGNGDTLQCCHLPSNEFNDVLITHQHTYQSLDVFRDIRTFCIFKYFFTILFYDVVRLLQFTIKFSIKF